MNPDLIVSSTTTIGTQIVVEMREHNEGKGTFYTVYVNDTELLKIAERFRAQAFYAWLVSGSGSGDTPTAKSWLELGYSKDTTKATPAMEKACKMVLLAKRYCWMVLPYRHRTEAQSRIEAYINQWR